MYYFYYTFSCGCSLQLSGLNSGKIWARLVDFGKTVDCRRDDIFAAVYVEVPAFAYHCTLCGADERPAASVVKMLSQYMSAVALVARVRYKMTAAMYAVELVDTRDGRDIVLSKVCSSSSSSTQYC